MQSADQPLEPVRAAELADALRNSVERALHGKPEVVMRAVVCLLARGHLLLEDVPGVGKTTLARALAKSLDADFSRVQFTSDLLPGDLLGLSVPEFVDGRPTPRFVFQPGPIFAHVVLADEINRASPKSQSALLEAMSERTVSVDGTTHALPSPFFVIATQNPLEHHGTHPLPESQLDRFMMRLSIGYPSREHEADVLREDPATHTLPELSPVLGVEALRQIQACVGRVKLADPLLGYLLDLAEATRDHEALELGASTRGMLALRRAAQARALIEGRDYCIPEDIIEHAVDVLAHRVRARVHGGPLRGHEAATWALRDILDRLPVPL